MTCRGYVTNGMQVPDYIEEGMRAIDPLISMVWNDVACLWQVQRLDPFTRMQHAVITIRNEDGSFRPLDRRALVDICKADVYRKYSGRHEKYFGALVEKDLKDQQDQYDKEKQKAADEQHDEARDKMVSALKKVDI